MTGYATYGREVLKRLHQSGKFDLAEFASYGTVGDERASDIPWEFYGNAPDENDERQLKEYNSVATNQFGEWRFEEVLLNFKPDIVFDIRDFWMFDYQERSPFRHLFHWAVMPTVDSCPQNEQWLATYSNADAVFNYSQWGMDVLKSEGGKNINCMGIAPPSADSAYKPIADKRAHKSEMGIDPSTKIVGTVMRNQRRKLYPDLFETFRKYLNSSGSNDTYLYCHTSYPDVGWDIPKLINKYGLSSKVLFTYVCSKCGHFFPTFFKDAITLCPNCKTHAAGLASVQRGVDAESLSKIMNIFDLYIQYANSEGFGLPQVEAASCAVPVMSVDYSAMSSVIRKIGGVPLKVKPLYQEMETGCDRAIPDNDFAASEIEKFFKLSESERMKKGRKTQQKFKKHYNWDKTAKVWEDYFDSVELKNESETWKSPPRISSPSPNVPNGLGAKDYAKWLIINVLCEPEKLDTYFESRLIRDLNYGMYLEGTAGMYLNEDSAHSLKPSYQPFNEEIAYKSMASLCNRRNYWEQIRLDQT